MGCAFGALLLLLGKMAQGGNFPLSFICLLCHSFPETQGSVSNVPVLSECPCSQNINKKMPEKMIHLLFQGSPWEASYALKRQRPSCANITAAQPPMAPSQGVLSLLLKLWKRQSPADLVLWLFFYVCLQHSSKFGVQHLCH